METFACLGDLFNWAGRPLFLSCPRCGRSFSHEEIEALIERENDNSKDRFIPITCSNCNKEMSVVDLITYA